MTERTALLLVVVLIAFLGIIAISAFYVGSSGVIAEPSASTTPATATSTEPAGATTTGQPTTRPAGTGAGTYTLRLGETVVVQGLAATLLEVVEDSRCPVDVQCVWAGTVEARVKLAYGAYSRTEVFELGVPKEALGYRATLTSVDPKPISGTTTPASSYRLHFSVKKL